MNTAATLFSGGGGADIGLDAADFDVHWGLELDDDIAQVARDNGLDIHTADVTEMNAPSEVDVLHASPPCPNFSVAKTGGEETDEDVSLARATVKYIQQTDPTLFTLENVWGYRKSRSWKLIREHLQRSGYDWNAWKLNAANYGVPQTRKRMIVAAQKGGPRPKKPPATHAETPSSGRLFGDELNEWIGWYEAVEDLIPDLPETKLADWQKERLPDDLTETALVSANSESQGTAQTRNPKEAAGSVVSTQARAMPRAVLVDQQNARKDGSTTTRDDTEPTLTVASSLGVKHPPPRAVLVSNAYDTPQDGDDRKPQTYDDEDPSPPTTVQHDGRLRAVLVDCWNGSENFGPDPLEEGDPASTISTDGRESHRPHAVLVNESSTLEARQQQQPAASQVATQRNNRQRAVMGRRVVQMTPRCLARFQTFPDWYDLPDSKSLACRIIGNAVPPLAMKKWIQHWTQ